MILSHRSHLINTKYDKSVCAEGEVVHWKAKWWEDATETVLGNSQCKPSAQTPARGRDLLSVTRVSNIKDLTATPPSEREMEAPRGTKARLSGE